MPQVRVKAADLIMVKAETDNFEGLHHEIEVKDLGIVSVSFKIITIREAHNNKIVLNTATLVNPIFRGIRAILIEAEAMAVDLNISENAVMVGPITHMTNNQNNMVLPAVYAADSTIPPKHCYKGEHDINNIMGKMSINPHQSQQLNLYQ